MFDGVIKFFTKINTNGVDKGALAIKTKVLKIKTSIENAEAEVRRLRAEMDKMAKAPASTTVGDKIEKDLEKARVQLGKLEAEADSIRLDKKGYLPKGLTTEQSDKLMDSMLKSDAQWQKKQQEIAQAESEVRKYEAELRNARATEAQTTGADTAAYRQKEERVRQLTGQIGVYNAQLEEVTATEGRSAATLHTLARAARTVASRMGQLARRGLSGVVSGLKKIFTHSKRAKSGLNSLSGAFKKFQRLGLALVGMRGLMAGFRQIVRSALDSNEKLQNSLNAVKGAMGTALSPVIEMLTSALTKLVSLADRVYQIFTGTSFIAKYNAQQTKKMAQEQAKAAKSAKNQQDYLAGFDELNVMQQNNTDSSDTAAQSPVPLLKRVSTPFDKFFKKLSKLFKKGDFKSIGAYLAESLNKGLKNIPWSKIQKTCKSISNKIADFVNGFVGKFNWKKLGGTIGNAINTITVTLHTLAVRIDWGKIGASIAKAFNGLNTAVSWKLLGQTLAKLINIPIHFAENFAYEFDWSKFGRKLSTGFKSFIEHLDLKAAAGALSGILHGVAETAQELFKSPGWGTFGDKLREALRKFFDGNPLNKIAETVRNALKALMTMAIKIFNGGEVAGKFGKSIGEAIKNWFKDKEWWTKVGQLLSTLALSLTEFMITVIENVTLDDIADAIITMIENIDWGRVFLKLCELIVKTAAKALYYAVKMIPGMHGIFELFGWNDEGFNNWTKNNLTLDLGAKNADTNSFLLERLKLFKSGNSNSAFQNNIKKGMNKAIKIPKYATGTYVPANYGEFLAVLGDNKREPEVVSPLSTMKQAFMEAIAEIGLGGNNQEITVVCQMDRDVLFKQVVKANNRDKKRRGRSQL